MINPGNAAKVLEKLIAKVEEYPKKEIPAIIRYVLREDFGINIFFVDFVESQIYSLYFCV
mgnify:CR=1 FL=1